MNYDRINRISEEVRKALDDIIRNSVKDPRVSGIFSITRADVTRDLSFCTVKVSVLEAEKREGTLEALKSAAGFIRSELGRKVKLRALPELIFELDTGMEYADHINRLLKEAEKKNVDTDARTNEED